MDDASGLTRHQHTATQALRVLAELAGSRSARPKRRFDVVTTKKEWLWQGSTHLSAFRGPPGQETASQSVTDKEAGEYLAGLDALQPRNRVLRAGWMWFVGTHLDDDGEKHSVCVPAVSAKIGIQRKLLARDVHAIADPYLTDLVEDPAASDHLLHSRRIPTTARSLLEDDGSGQSFRLLMKEWASEVAEAAGLTIDQWKTTAVDPWEFRGSPGIAAVPGVGIYVDTSEVIGGRARLLSDWTDDLDLGGTAFEAIYTDGPFAGPVAPREYPHHHSTRPLSMLQQRVVDASKSERVVTVSGPPGTGKTHTIIEIALAAIARGESVLVGAGTSHAVDVLLDHFIEAPGPRPITFGGEDAGDVTADIQKRLAAAEHPGGPEAALLAVDHACSQYERHASSIHRLLESEQLVAGLRGDPAQRLLFEDLLRPIDRPERVAGRVEEVCGGGRWSRWRARKQRRDLGRELGLGDHATTADMRRAAAKIERYLGARALIAHEGLTLANSIDHLADLGEARSRAAGELLDATSLDRLRSNRSGRRALSALLTAVRSGRSKRRATLAAIDADALVRAAPLWLGNVADIDDVLPMRPRLFDLVILDEASQVDQISAAGALIRAERAVICGDPNQLRHVSFISDDDVSAAASKHLGSPSPLFDVRRNSIYDTAVAAAVGFTLDEHFRCDPHLIRFSARRFYDGELHIATATPQNHAADHIDTVVAAGERDDRKVNRAHVEMALDLVDTRISAGERGIGIVTPFRNQADAVTEAVLARYRVSDIEDHDLAVGTVHAFQGAEYDTVIALFAVGAEEPSSSWRFVNNSNLFNVMVTRARRKMIVVTTADSAPGLAGEYLRHADPNGEAPASTGVVGGWPGRVAEALDEARVTYWPNYAVGSHVIDFAIETPSVRPIALVVRPHPDGPETHVRRALALRTLGWSVEDAFESAWADRFGELVIRFEREWGP